jgi:hypothetical protein
MVGFVNEEGQAITSACSDGFLSLLTKKSVDPGQSHVKWAGTSCLVILEHVLQYHPDQLRELDFLTTALLVTNGFCYTFVEMKIGDMKIIPRISVLSERLSLLDTVPTE